MSPFQLLPSPPFFTLTDALSDTHYIPGIPKIIITDFNSPGIPEIPPALPPRARREVARVMIIGMNDGHGCLSSPGIEK